MSRVNSGKKSGSKKGAASNTKKKGLNLQGLGAGAPF